MAQGQGRRDDACRLTPAIDQRRTRPAALHLDVQSGTSILTIEGYRASIMRKVGARNAAELLRRVLSQSRTA